MKHWIALFFLLALCAKAHAASGTLSWDPATTNTDGTPLTDITGYRLYAGTSEATLAERIIVAPTVRRYTIEGLAPGLWYFGIKTLTTASKSEMSGIVSATVSDPAPTCGAQPANETRMQTCTAPLVGSFQQTMTYQSAPAPTCWTPGPWIPTEAASGICALPSPLVTSGPLSYQDKLTSMGAIGLVPAGLPCGPDTKIVAGVKYCKITRAQTDLIVWPVDLNLAAIWARAK